MINFSRLFRQFRSWLDNFGDWLRYLIQIFIVVIFGFLPFFALILRNSTYALSENKSPLQDIWSQAFSGGQLYLYVFSIFGTLMWLGLFDWTQIYSKMIIFLMFVIVILGYFIFGLANFDPTFSQFGKVDEWVVKSSYYTFVGCLVIYWLLLISRKPTVPQVGDILSDGADKQAKEYRELED